LLKYLIFPSLSPTLAPDDPPFALFCQGEARA
jgi:hypothetical protein